MLGSAFVQTYASRGYAAWEAAVVAMAVAGGADLCPWPWATLTLADDEGHVAELSVMTDVLAVGTIEDHVRMPLRPGTMQSIANAMGWLLPTPWIVYQTWRAASRKVEPKGIVPNVGANLAQYAAHSLLVDRQLAELESGGGSENANANADGIASGTKKSVVVGNKLVPGKVVIFGWYRPSPPAPDVFDDGQNINDPRTKNRQPVQPLSDAHGDFYVDYSHGMQPVSDACVVDGAPMRTEDLYRHPTLSHLVSHEGPVRVARYAARIPPRGPAPPSPGRTLPLVVQQTRGSRTRRSGD